MQTQTPNVQLRCDGDPGDPDAPPSPTNYSGWSSRGFDNPTTCAGGLGAATPIPEYSFWADSFEYPEILKANVGYEGLVTDRTRLSVNLLYSEGTQQYNVRNINLRPVQFQIPGEGRRVYTPLDVFSPSGGNEEASRINTQFANVYGIYADGRNRAILATIEGRHTFSDELRLGASYTFNRAWDNVSESCCTSGGIHEDPTVGPFGPNDLGDLGDSDRAWGRSDFGRDHTFILSGFARLPWDVEVAAIWRIQSGRPWTPEVQGDLNGDGVRFNDRPFVFAPGDLPLDPSLSPEDAQAIRSDYAQLLADNDCVGDYVGRFIERNTCRFPATNRLDMKLTKGFETFGGQRAEVQLDLFNVVNGIGQIFCSEDDRTSDPTGGACGWGRVNGIFGADRNLYTIEDFDRGNRRVIYEPISAADFASESVIGTNLLLQFQAQIGLRYYF